MRVVGIAMNGVTGRMGTNQHLVRSILAIREQGGVPVDGGASIWPEPVLVGRNEEKLRGLAEEHGLERFTTSLARSGNTGAGQPRSPEDARAAAHLLTGYLTWTTRRFATRATPTGRVWLLTDRLKVRDANGVVTETPVEAGDWDDVLDHHFQMRTGAY